MAKPLETNTLGDAFSNCQICHDLWRRFTDPKVTHPINLGSFKDATSSKCEIHTPLIEKFAEYCEWAKSTDVGCFETASRDELSSVGLTQSLSKGSWVWQILLVKKESVKGHPGIGRILDPNWVDLEILKKWKNECLSSHGQKCRNPMRISPMRPAWVIDVQNKCIIPGSQCTSFVALSYRWGLTRGFQIDASMVELFKGTTPWKVLISPHTCHQ